MLNALLPTLVNALAVLMGSAIGLLLHGRLSNRFREILFQAIGLATVVIGMRDALATNHIPILALSMILGALAGEGLNLEGRLESLGGLLQRRLYPRGDGEFIQGFVTAGLLFCVGAMTVVGALRAGVGGNGEIYYTKSLLDGHAAVFLAGALGAGVMASAGCVLCVQGGLTLLFMIVGANLPDYVVREVGAAGGLMILAISINLLGIGKVRVGNLLPGMLFAGVFIWFKHSLG